MTPDNPKSGVSAGDQAALQRWSASVEGVGTQGLPGATDSPSSFSPVVERPELVESSPPASAEKLAVSVDDEDYPF